MRTGFVAVVMLALLACGEDYSRKDLTAPTVPAPTAAVVAAPEVDTAHASSICRASVRTQQAARLQLSTTPGDALAQKKWKASGALVSSACK